MITITKNKIINTGALRTLNTSLDVKYLENYLGVTQQIDTGELIVSMVDNTNESAVRALMNGYEDITCNSSGMTITITMGTIIVSDVTLVTANPGTKKFILMLMAINNATGEPLIYAFEKTQGNYGSFPDGYQEATKIKEYSVEAGGTTLVEINNYL